MNILTLLILVALIPLVFAAWNGFLILWKQDKQGQRNSKIWHKLGWILRLLIHILLFMILADKGYNLYEQLLWQCVCLNFTYTFYDIIINFVRDVEILYIDKKGFNKFVLKIIGIKLFWIFRLLFLLLTSVMTIIYYT